MRLIGLTGGIATGKTTVAKYIASRYNAPILNVDDISSSVTAIGSPVLDKIVEHFGSECLSEDGSINRTHLRQVVIDNKDEASTLERIVIPAIMQSMSIKLQELTDNGHEVVFVENSVMFEKGTYKNYDEVLVVTCPPETQLDRLIHRYNQTTEQARDIIKAQWPLRDKEELATYLIRNDNGVDKLESEIERVWEELMENKNES